MKVLLVALNAKYIHTNLAIRSLRANTTYPVTLMEFSIKEGLSLIRESILKEMPDVIGFSVYIWNVEHVKKLLDSLQGIRVKIILGGPEVSFDSTNYFQYPAVDFVISGEGETAFQELLEALDGKRSIENVSNLTYREKDQIRSSNRITLPNTRTLIFDESIEEDYSHRIQYVEMSRGCPYHCSYCLASLEKRVRFFPREKVESHLLFLMNQGAKTFKFLDRTFNADDNKALEMMDFLVKNHRVGQVFQFEMTADRMSKEFIDKVHEISEPHLFRFEIGIQSLSTKSNLAVHRRQNNDVLFENIRRLQSKGIVDLHLDLIAGLPYETKESFIQTFDQVFSLHAKELQLGFLKLLKGTKLREEQHLWGYEFEEISPYHIKSSSTMSEADFQEISSAESALEVFWNRGFMKDSFMFLSKQVHSPFQLFLDLSEKARMRSLSLVRFQMDELFVFLKEYYLSMNYSDFPRFEYLLQKDYLNYFPIKPKKWWTIEKRNETIESFHLEHTNIALEDFYKYGVIFGNQDYTGIVLYYPNGKQFYERKSSQM